MWFDEISKSEKRFRYMLLSRMQSDCEYYLGNGNRSQNCLWGETETAHIGYMKTLWNSFSEKDKPEWLTYEQICEYERKMCPEKITLQEKIKVTEQIHTASASAMKEKPIER